MVQIEVSSSVTFPMKKIYNIQLLRGLSATAVMISHAVGTVLTGDIPRPPVPDLLWGAFGVDVFFVISGFVMTYTSFADFGSVRSIGPFLGRRIIRIVPLYWLATLAFALMALPYLDRSETRAMWQDMVRSMFFIPGADGHLAMLPPGWSLYFEVMFYAFFAAVLAFRRRVALAGLTALMLMLMAAGSLDLLPTRIASLGSSQLLEFVSGLYIAEAWLSGWRVPRRIGYAIAAVAVIAVALTWPLPAGWLPWRGIVWGSPATVIVACLILMAQPDVSTAGAVSTLFDQLGDASYSIYLTHFPLFWISDGWLFWIAKSGPHGAQTYVCLLIVMGLAVSLLVHRVIERPLSKALRFIARTAVRHRLSGRSDAERRRRCPVAATPGPAFLVPSTDSERGAARPDRQGYGAGHRCVGTPACPSSRARRRNETE